MKLKKKKNYITKLIHEIVNVQIETLVFYLSQDIKAKNYIVELSILEKVAMDLLSRHGNNDLTLSYKNQYLKVFQSISKDSYDVLFEIKKEISFLDIAYAGGKKLQYNILQIKSNKELRKLKREIKNRLYNVKRITVVQKAKKNSISHNQIVSALSSLSLFLFLCSIIRAYIISQKFGFKLSYAYTIGDYISSAIDPIISSFFYFIIGGSIFFLNFDKESNGERALKQNVYRYLNIGVFMFFTLACLYSYIEKRILNDFTLLFIYILGLRIFVFNIVKYFKEPKKVYYTLFFVVFFIINIVGSTIRYADSILEESNNIKYKINSKVEKYLNIEIIDTTSNFTIVWDRNKDNVVFISNSEITSIEISN